MRSSISIYDDMFPLDATFQEGLEAFVYHHVGVPGSVLVARRPMTSYQVLLAVGIGLLAN
jgi:hypothetical protein